MEQTERAARIEAAAYKVLEEKGFKGASMLAIAKEAKASNETLYKWYGDKTGLFAAMIRSNSEVVLETLQRAQSVDHTGCGALRDVGRSLLSMVTSNKAVALNRAAAGDHSGKLGKILAEEGRGRVAPIIAQLLVDIAGSDAEIEDMTDCYLSLLIGDLQIKRATGAIGTLGQDDIKARADKALCRFQRLYPSPKRTP